MNTQWRFFAGVLVVGVLAFFYRFDPAESRLYPVCPSFQWFGFQCATCGGLRAVHALMHGNIIAAWQLNPLVVIFPGLLIVEWLWTRWRGVNPVRRMLGLAALLLALVAFTIWRNL
ncbi:MAG TPA: DUF2752 domain-containing protein [Kiritimatiellia bacterium]|nr:DUF2752 domain-containing protein [Kiritimatiellia bacterium]